jgi:hypothetical protein
VYSNALRLVRSIWDIASFKTHTDKVFAANHSFSTKLILIKYRLQVLLYIPQSQRRRVGVSFQSYRPTNTPPTAPQATSSNTTLPILPRIISYPRHIQHGNRHSPPGPHIHRTRLGIQPYEINARSLRAGGATALLCVNIDPNSIQLLGRWKSDAMLRYLHIAANPHVRQYAKKMFSSGTSSFNPCFPNTSTHT